MFKLNIKTVGLRGYEREENRWYKYQMLGNLKDNAMSLAHYRMEQMGATYEEVLAMIDAIWDIDFDDIVEHDAKLNGYTVKWEREGKSVAITVKNS